MSDNTAPQKSTQTTAQTRFRPGAPRADAFATAMANLATAGIGFEEVERPMAPDGPAGPWLDHTIQVAEAA
ncbi:MAG: hypothetical protein WB239_12045 [Acidimicrobiia bacterium]